MKRIQTKYDKLQQTIQLELNRLSQIRLGTFILFVIFLVLSVRSLSFVYILPLILLLFVYFIRKYNRLNYRKNVVLKKILFLEQNRDRISDDWQERLSYHPEPKATSFTKDVGLTGQYSLWHQLYLNSSSFAKERLSSLFTAVQQVHIESVEHSRNLIQLLKQKALRRTHFFALINLIQWNKSDVESFNSWLKRDDGSLKQFIYFKSLAVVFVLNFIFAIYINEARFVLAQLFVHFILVLIYHKSWQEMYLEGLSKEVKFSRFATVFHFVATRYKQELPLLKQDLPTVDFLDVFADFQRLNDRLSLVYSGMGYGLLNAVTFWDAWYVPALMRWKKRYSQDYPKFFDLLAELECAEMLANYTYLKPQYSVPMLNKDHKIVALDVVHPLLPENRAISNNFTSNRSEITIVSGSNMSGKTTFLRTIALNSAMAYLGLPVAASRFELGEFRLESSITIEDSLSDGVSFFYAEVKRLKTIVEACKKVPVLFFIDEMLKGTNGRERSIASRNVLEQLLNTDAIGLFSTHDLSLAAVADDYPQQIKNVHFVESEDSETLCFDYKLKQGIVKSTNALAILKREGLYKT